MIITTLKPQISFAINNRIGDKIIKKTIYKSDKEADNNLSFLIAATAPQPDVAGTDGDATFYPADPVPFKDANKSKGSLVYLNLRPLSLSNDEFGDLKFKGDGRLTGTLYKVDHRICFTCSKTFTLKRGEEISIQLTGFRISKPPGDATIALKASTYRVGGISEKEHVVTFGVVLVNPGQGKELDEAIRLNVLDAHVLCSIQKETVGNRLTFSLYVAGKNKDIVDAGPDTRFFLNFVYADDPGYGALTTGIKAKDIELSQTPSDNKWKIDFDRNAQYPFWTLRPPNNKPIVRLGEAVQFGLKNIVTSHKPGPTEMLVSYSGVPGYKDGSYAALLQKLPHVVIEAFKVEPATSVLEKDGKAKPTLKWLVRDARSLTLLPVNEDVTNKTEFPVNIARTTKFELEAFGFEHADNRATASLTATVRPVIKAFEVWPTDAIYHTDFPRKVNLKWDVNTNEKIKLSSSTEGDDPVIYAPKGSVAKEVSKPQTISLTVRDEPDPLLRRSVSILAFRVTSSHNETLSNGAPQFVAAPRAAGFVAVTVPGANVVRILSSTTWRPIGDPIAVGKKPAGLAFGPDDGRLFVANAGDGTVSVVKVTATGSSPPYTFEVEATVTVGQAPQQVAVSPDGRFVYVTIDKGTMPGYLVVLFERARTWTGHNVQVGAGPRGIAVTADGKRIFVANHNADTISVLERKSSGGPHDTHMRSKLLPEPIDNVGKAPEGLAITPDGRWLLVACSGSNQVCRLDYENPGKERHFYEVGGGPRQVTVAPGGIYAFVSDGAGNSVSMLRGDPPGRVTEVLVGDGGTFKSPHGLVATHDGGSVVVAHEHGVRVLTLSKYEAAKLLQVPVSSASKTPVTDVVVAPGAKARAVAWFDALLTISDITPMKGLLIVENEGISHKLTDLAVTSFAFSPGDRDHLAYLTAMDAHDVRVLDTNMWAAVARLPIQPKGDKTSRRPVRLAVSGNGKRVFVAVVDGSGQYSVVAFAANPVERKFKLLSDLVVCNGSTSPGITLCALPDGSKAFVLNKVEAKLWTIEGQADESYQLKKDPLELPGEPLVTAVAVSPDGAKLQVLIQARTRCGFCAIDTATLRSATTYLDEEIGSIQLRGFAFTPDGARLLATDGSVAGVRVIDPVSLRVVETIGWDGGVSGPLGIAVSLDGASVFVANPYSGNVAIVEQLPPHSA